MLKRIFDIVFSGFGLIVLFPFMFILGLLVVVDSKGAMFYGQMRIGQFGRAFKLFKYRTMIPNADSKGLLTVGGKDPRVTRVGYYFRKYKLDELPQLFNVLIGDMSLVGPRPEVKKYVDLYSEEQKKVLLVRPGITDYASLDYFEESDLLAKSNDPEKTYIEVIMPAKLELNKKYLHDAGMATDLKIIGATLKRILKRG